MCSILFFICAGLPHKRNTMGLFIQNTDLCVRKLLPADPSVGICLMGAHSQHCIQKQYALLCPFFQISIVGYITAAVLLQFLVNIHQGRRNLHIRLHRKTQAVSLSVIVIRILSQYDHFHLVQGGKMKCIENIVRCGEYLSCLVFLPHLREQLFIIWFSELRL